MLFPLFSLNYIHNDLKQYMPHFFKITKLVNLRSVGVFGISEGKRTVQGAYLFVRYSRCSMQMTV
jgi:hypothetical protein